MAQEYYTILTNAGLAYEAQSKANQTPIRLTHLAVGDGNGAAYNPGQEASALRRETHRQEINALLQDEANPSWLLAEALLPDDVGGFTIREVGIYTDTGILYAIGKYPDSIKPILGQGSTKQFYVRAIFQTSNASIVTLVVDNNVVQATRAFVLDHVKSELEKLDHKNSVRVATTAQINLSTLQTVDGVALVAGDRVLVKNMIDASLNGIYLAAAGAWLRAADANASIEVTPGMIVPVEQGTTLADTRWQLVTDGAIVLGTTALTFQNVTKGFAPLSSPAFTGNPTAPTPAQFDQDESLATTEFVQGALGNFAYGPTISAAINLAAGNCGQAFRCINSGYTVGLPQINGVIPNGAAVLLKNTGTGSITVTRQGADNITIDGSAITSIALGVGDSALFVIVGGVWSVMGGEAALGKSAQFSASLLPHGYQKLPSGQIKQWGAAIVPSGGSVDITLPIAFPVGGLRTTFGRQAVSNLTAAAAIGYEFLSPGTLRIYAYSTEGGNLTVEYECTGR